MLHAPAHFRDRAEAGRLLGQHLAAMRFTRPVVFALPRGGVPVGLEIARALKAPLDIVLVRKLGAPGAPEMALGAVAEGAELEAVINQDVRHASRAGAVFLERARVRAAAEIERRRAVYTQDRPCLAPAGCDAIVVDDGLATGATARAALAAVRRQGAARAILAVPVAPRDVLAGMADAADLVVCLRPADHFEAVGLFYRDFHQMGDAETISLLRQAWSQQNAPTSPA